MSARVFYTKLGADSSWHFWFEVSPDAFVLGDGWKDVALHLGHWAARGSTATTQTLAKVRELTPDIVEVTDRM